MRADPDGVPARLNGGFRSAEIVDGRRGEKRGAAARCDATGPTDCVGPLHTPRPVPSIRRRLSSRCG